MCEEDIAEFPYEHFLNYFPQFSPETATENTPVFLYACGDRAAMYLSNYPSAWLNGKRRLYAHCLLAAHIVYLTRLVERETSKVGGMSGSGEASVGPVTSASVGGVNVSMAAPQSSGDGAFEFWLNRSPYGQEFLGLIRTRGPMIAFIGSKTPVLPLR